MTKAPHHVWKTLTKAEKETVRRNHYGRCEVEGCEDRAVAYHAACMWRLCAKHAAQHAKRTKE